MIACIPFSNSMIYGDAAVVIYHGAGRGAGYGFGGVQGDGIGNRFGIGSGSGFEFAAVQGNGTSNSRMGTPA